MTRAASGPGPRDPDWWPEGYREQHPWPPCFPGERWFHVLLGDPYGGGHLRSAVEHWRREGATAFPAAWTAHEIAQAVLELLTTEMVRLPDEHTGIVSINGRRIQLRVVLRADWESGARRMLVRTVHPIRGAGVVQVVHGQLRFRPIPASER